MIGGKKIAARARKIYHIPWRTLNRVMFHPHELMHVGDGDAPCLKRSQSDSDDGNGERGRRIVLSAADARAQHIRNVLQSQPGDVLRGCVSNEGLCDVLIQQPAADNTRELSMTIGEVTPGEFDLALDVILCCPRPKRFKSLLPHVGQLGVRALHVTKAEKVESAYLGSGLVCPMRKEKMDALLSLGVMQAGVSARLPSVRVWKQLHRLLLSEEWSKVYDVCAVLHPCDAADKGVNGNIHLSSLLQRETNRLAKETNKEKKNMSVMLAIGPEGGFVPQEVEALTTRGFHLASLGPAILRSDTAFITAVGTAHAVLYK